jgi:hypothetical protein
MKLLKTLKNLSLMPLSLVLILKNKNMEKILSLELLSYLDKDKILELLNIVTQRSHNLLNMLLINFLDKILMF